MLPEPRGCGEAARRGLHRREARVPREGAGGWSPDPGQVPPRPPAPVPRCAKSGCFFLNRRPAGGGPPRTSAAAPARETPAPAPHSRGGRAGRPRAPGRAGPGTRLGRSAHSRGARGPRAAAGSRARYATGATPPKPGTPRPAAPGPAPTGRPRPRQLLSAPHHVGSCPSAVRPAGLGRARAPASSAAGPGRSRRLAPRPAAPSRRPVEGGGSRPPEIRF